MRITTKKEIEHLIDFLIDEHAWYILFEIIGKYVDADNNKER